MIGAPATDVDVGGHSFVVRYTESRAEAVRVSPAQSQDKIAMIALSASAIRQASGCAIRPGTLYGDSVMAEAFLDCPDNVGVTLIPSNTWRP